MTGWESGSLANHIVLGVGFADTILFSRGLDKNTMSAMFSGRLYTFVLSPAYSGNKRTR
jgi:hypothetical protein